MQVLGFPESRKQSRALAAALGVAARCVDVHHFPDGESRVTVPATLDDHVIVYRSLDDPNAKLVELMLCAAAAREHGARTLTLVAPYMCYMRQDVAFAPGEAVSQHIVGTFLAEHFESVITVDPHLHRTRNLADAVPAARAIALSAALPMGRFLAQHRKEWTVVGPDAESAQWVSAIAKVGEFDTLVASKQRHGDRDVEVHLPPCELHGRHAVLVDDVVSTGRTLAAAATALRAAEAATVDVLVTHALFVGDAFEQLRRAGVREVWSSDSISHFSNRIALAELLAEALARGATVSG
jgi:ribose-phosphate pyrophosphokinase